MLKKLGLILILSLGSCFSSFGVIENYPRSGNALFNLFIKPRQYFTLLALETTVVSPNQHCREYRQQNHGGDVLNSYLLCAYSELQGNTLKDSLVLFSNDIEVQRFVFVQKGDGLKPTPLASLFNFNFRLKGNQGRLETTGLTALTANYRKTPDHETFQLEFEPVKFFLRFVSEKRRPEMTLLRYEASCVFCFGVSWLSVSEVEREGLPSMVLYHNSELSTDITPRLFDQQLGGLFYRPLSQLSSTIVRTLVSEADFPDIQI